MTSVFASHDALILPSHWPENEPVVLLEAIAAGLGVIASDLGGCADLISSGETGILVPPGDPSALKDAMSAYLQSGGLLRAHADKNVARRASFDETISFDAYEADYTRLAHHNRPSRPHDARATVICGTGWPTHQVAAAINVLRMLESKDQHFRLIPADWADAADWRCAAALWIWSESGDEALIRRALSNDVMVIGPKWHPSLLALQGAAAIAGYDDHSGMIAALWIARRRTRKSHKRNASLIHEIAALRSKAGSYELKAEAFNDE